MLCLIVPLQIKQRGSSHVLWYHLALRWHPNTVLFHPQNPCDSFIPSSQLPLCLRSWIAGSGAGGSLLIWVLGAAQPSKSRVRRRFFPVLRFSCSSFTLTSVLGTYRVSQHGYPVWPCSHYFLTEIAGRQSYFRRIWTKRPKMMEIKKYSADTQANKGKQTPWLNWGGTGQRHPQRIQLSLTRINK